MTSAQAAACLGVKRATLYSYVARGLVRAVTVPGRGRRYLESDVLALKRRSAAAKGHAAAAAVALDWGAPVLQTAISAVDRDGPSYRGRSAWTLAERDTPFEAVARGLWQGWAVRMAEDTTVRPFEGVDDGVEEALAALAPVDAGAALRLALALDDLDEPEPLMDRLPRALGVVGDPDPGGPMAERLVAIHGLDPSERGIVERTLVLCADHELNASTFAARVAASAGASLAGALMCAMGAFLGPRHGGQVLDVAALVAEGATDPEAAVRAQLAEGRLRGFGHRLYPEGDPRAEALLGWIGDRAPITVGWTAAARAAGAPPPTLDVSLVAVAEAVGAPATFAMTAFAVGRAAGWIAHALEQRTTPGILRPRARYVP